MTGLFLFHSKRSIGASDYLLKGMLIDQKIRLLNFRERGSTSEAVTTRNKDISRLK